MQLWALVQDSFRESKDRKIFWVMLCISLFVAAAMFCVGFAPGKVDFLFGTWVVETDRYTIDGVLRPELVATIAVDGVLDGVLGTLGILLGLIATAGFLPAALERGAIEVLLSKPLPRWQLFLGKYVGSMVFIAFHAAIFVVITFLVIGFRWRAWLPGYFLAIPLMVLLFSYLYCVSALVAVFLRSTVAAVLLSIAAWMAFGAIQTAPDVFFMEPEFQKYETAYQAAKIARWVVPKTQDITYKAKHWSKAAVGTHLVMDDDPSAEDQQMLSRAEQLERQRMELPAVYTIGTSLLFEAFVVALAMWKFSRQDY